MKLADYVIEFLRDNGIKQVFLVYGAAIGDLVDAFSRVKGIEYICVIHEQSGSFAVETQAKITGKPSCFIATSGPGGINILNGIANAYYDSVPCIFITGQINSQFLRKDISQRQIGFQENDIVGMAKPITKMATMVTKPEDIKRTLTEAIRLSITERPGPVLIDIPLDIQRADIEPDELDDYITNQDVQVEIRRFFESRMNIVNSLDDLIGALKKAKRPVLLIGGGIWWAKATNRVRLLGEILKIPCLVTWNATDIFTSDYPYYCGRVGTYGGPGRNFAIQNSDLLLCIGTRISGRITGGYIESFARGATKYIVDISQGLLNSDWQDIKGNVNLCCDARLFTRELIKYLTRTQMPDWADWLALARHWKDKYQPCLPEYFNTPYVHPYVFVKTLSEECQSNDIIIVDCGGNAVVTFQTFETKFGQRLISSNGNSPMGYSFAGAIGASFLPKNEKRVICLTGDGGFQMNLQELQTIKHYGLKLKTFILNNHSYGITRQFQDTNYQSRYLASGPDGYSVPDFTKIIDAYGIKTETIKNHSELRDKIRYVLNYSEAIVCDVDCGMFSQYEPRIFGWKTPIEDMYPYLPRDEFRANMIIPPLKGWENGKYE